MGTHPIFESDFDCLTVFRMEEVESKRLLSDDELPTMASGDYQFMEEYINYKYISPVSGNQHEVRVKVTVQGDPSSRASFLTMHDMGMTYDSQFSTLVNCELFDPIRSKFCICHINIPGLESGSADIHTGCYPTLDQMAEMIPYIVEKFKLKRIYLFGVGVGSNIFLRYMLNDQSKVEGLIFANPLFSQQPWSGYFWNKVIGMGTSYDILNDYHFNNDYNTENCIDVYQAHQQNFKSFHPANLRELITTVDQRTAINLVRTEMGKSNVRVPSLLLVGDSSPFNEDAAELNSGLNPSITTFAKLQDAGSMILEQQPMKVAEAILLFLKGEGHFTNLSILEISKKRAKAVAQQQEIIDGEKQDPISV